MKARFLVWSMVLLTSVSAVAQQIEIDDMYFNSKDRVAMNASRAPLFKASKAITEESTPLNPTDSYSARNVNPEYISRAKMDPNSQVATAPYFIPNFQPKTINQNLYPMASNYSNNNWNNPYYNNYAGYNSFGNPYGYSSFGNPYGSYYPYSMYGSNSYYGSPWSSWLSLTMGYGYGSWGMCGNPYMSLYNTGYYGNMYGYNNYMRYNGFYNPFYSNPYGYTYTYVTSQNTNVQERGLVDGRQSMRGSEIDNYYSKPGSRFADSGANTGGRFSNGTAFGQTRNDSQDRTDWGTSTRRYQQNWSNSWGDSGSRGSSFSSGSSSRSSFSGGGSGGASISTGGGGGGGSRRGRD